MVDCHISYIRKWGKKRKKEKRKNHCICCFAMSHYFTQKKFEKNLGKCNVKYFFPTEFCHLCSIRNSKGKKKTLVEKKTLTPIDKIGKVGPTMGPPFLSIQK